MSVDRVLARARAAFIRRMRATCTIRRVTGTTLDPLTGADVPTFADVYSGPCYTRYPGLAFEQNPEAGGAVYTISRLVVRIPHGAQIRPGDLVTIDADPDSPQMAGTTVRVASADDQSQASAQRLLCEDYQAGVSP